MEYKAAQSLIDKHRHLEGKNFNGREITYLITVPTARGGIAKIIDGITRQLSIESINSHYDDFKVIALLDFDNFHLTGYLFQSPLDDILNAQAIAIPE